jgi:hypothetical protein
MAPINSVPASSTVTKQFNTEGVVALIRSCLADGSRGVALRGYELLAKIGGHIVAKRDIRVVQSWDDLSDDELRALAGAEPPPGDDSANGQS